jgi:hypothetical protein
MVLLFNRCPEGRILWEDKKSLATDKSWINFVFMIYNTRAEEF